MFDTIIQHGQYNGNNSFVFLYWYIGLCSIGAAFNKKCHYYRGRKK